MSTARSRGLDLRRVRLLPNSVAVEIGALLVVRREHRPLLTVLDCDAVPLVRDPLTAEQAASVAALFKALSDPVRLRLLSLIASHAGGEACVCDLTPAFDVSEPTISHHLKVLREAGLVSSERRASWVYYRLVPEALTGLGDLLDATGMATTGGRR